MSDLRTTELLLGVNLDHVATLRQVRLTTYPDLLAAVAMAEKAGADGITLHLREDQRHIQANDVLEVQAMVQTRLNLEIAISEAMLEFAVKVKPKHCCLVPERREELTTEGGLDVCRQIPAIMTANQHLSAAGIQVSLFIAPDINQIIAAAQCGVAAIELHTGDFANAATPAERATELLRLQQAVCAGREHGLIVNAGHGLNYTNVSEVAALHALNELNIGHSIVARAVFVGLLQAVQEMKALLRSVSI
jgi:pyridoxine 5-phosphate synthase